MVRVVSCGTCGKRHRIPDELYERRFRGREVTIGCRQCGSSIAVDGTQPNLDSDSPAEYGPVSDTPWVVLIPGRDNRELTRDEIVKALRTGELTTSQLVWQSGMGDWQPIFLVPDFAPYLDSLEEDEPTHSEQNEKDRTG